MDKIYLSIHDVMRRYSIGRRTVWRWVSKDILPAPEKITDQCSRWLVSELDRYDAERLAARDSQAA